MRVGRDSCGPLNLSPAAGGGREAKAPVGRERGAVRTAATNGLAASGLRGRAITPGGGAGASEAGRGESRVHCGDQLELGQRGRGGA